MRSECISPARSISPSLLIPHDATNERSSNPRLPISRLLQQFLRRTLPVALGIVLGPAPQVLARLLDAALRLPAQLLIRARRVRRQVQDIARATRHHLVRQVAAHRFPKRLDHVEDRRALAGAEVPGAHARVVRAQVVERDEVALGQVEDVDVVADGGAVVRVVIVAEDEELLAQAHGDLRQQRQQVVRHTLRVLAHDAARVAARRVEVAQQRRVPLLGFVVLPGLFGVRPRGIGVVGDGGFRRDLGVAVRVRRPQRTDLRDGDHVREARRVAVHGRRRGEDDVVHRVPRHGPQQAQRAVDIGVPVVEGSLAGLADGLPSSISTLERERCAWGACLEGGKVNDAVDGRVLFKDAVKGRLVGDIEVHKGRPLAADELDAVEDLVGRVVQVVGHDHLVVGLEQRERREGPDVAGAPCMLAR